MGLEFLVLKDGFTPGVLDFFDDKKILLWKREQDLLYSKRAARN